MLWSFVLARSMPEPRSLPLLGLDAVLKWGGLAVRSRRDQGPGDGRANRASKSLAAPTMVDCPRKESLCKGRGCIIANDEGMTPALTSTRQ